VGLHWISQGGRELAAVGRVQTPGLGNSHNDELLDIADRKWARESAAKISWRGSPVHVEFQTCLEASGRHDGLISQLAVSLPMNWSRGHFVPGIEVIPKNSDFADYYYTDINMYFIWPGGASRVGSGGSG
jgi:hypothetical protein